MSTRPRLLSMRRRAGAFCVPLFAALGFFCLPVPWASAHPASPLDKELARCLAGLKDCRSLPRDGTANSHAHESDPTSRQPSGSSQSLAHDSLSRPLGGLLYTSRPDQAGISGQVTYKGSPAANIQVVLRRYTPGAGNETSVLTATTGSNGAYQFARAPSLATGQVYYVRYRNDANDDRYLALWFGADIASYTSGRAAAGGDFDIEDVGLIEPPAGTSRSIPAYFTWQKRPVTTDTYRWRLMTDDLSQEWLTDDLGYVDNANIIGLPAAVGLEIPYWWSINIYSGADSFGLAHYRRTITFTAPTWKAYMPAASR